MNSLNMVGIAVCLGFALYYATTTYKNYQHQTAPLLVLGLWMLGVLNVVVGCLAVAAEYPLGAVAVAVGVASIELGALLHAYLYTADGINWTHHAALIGSQVFFVGLLWL